MNNENAGAANTSRTQTQDHSNREDFYDQK